MKIVWSNAAIKQLEAACDFVAVKSPKAAVRLYKEILDETDKLGTLPEMARFELSLSETTYSYRALIVNHTYKVIYRVDFDSAEVMITSVWDCRQAPKTLVKKTVKRK
jgi:plasmid stabilization system protein ParE